MMKSFILKVICFLCIVLFVDLTLGYSFRYMHNHAKGGDNGRVNAITREVTADIIIMGSSRAENHYNPIIIENEMGKSCYNCGMSGNGIVCNYGLFELITQRCKPYLVIYDIHPMSDYYNAFDNHRYLSILKPFYNNLCIRQIFDDVDKYEKYKMLSSMYQYNSTFFRIVTDYLHPRQESGVKGFRPFKEQLDTMKLTNKKEKKQYDIDSLKVEYLDRLAKKMEGHIVFIISPIWEGDDGQQFQFAKQFCEMNGIPLLDYSNNPKYVHHDEFFKDGGHLNYKGADVFSKDIASELKSLNLNKE